MNQVALATAIGVAPMAVSKWVAGGGISDRNLDAICEVLGSTPTWIRWGEDVFSDQTWMETTMAGGEFVRRLMNSSSRLELSSSIETSIGFVMWMKDNESNSWLWSGNASKIFGLKGAHGSSARLNEQVDSLMTENDCATIYRIFDDLESGRRSSGWCIYSLRHLPGVLFKHVARAIPANGGKVNVCGVTVSSAGVLGSCELINWQGPRSSYEAAVERSPAL